MTPESMAHVYGTSTTDYRSPAFMEWAAKIDWEQFPGNVVYIMCISVRSMRGEMQP